MELKPMNYVIPDRRVRLAVLALGFGSGLCLLMLAARNVFALSRDQNFYRDLDFYPWNLLLAWIPLLLATWIYGHYAQNSPRSGPLLAICAVLWFLFFTNAPYIVTDLVHLKARAPVPKWFDMAMMASYAWTGRCLGYFSLHLMQEVVRARWGTLWGWRFAGGMLAASSFGIYLGRFERWNSWDIFTRPLGSAGDVLRHADCVSHPQAMAFSATFFAFSLVSYVPLCALIHLHGGPAMEKPVGAAQLMR
jgi:uncharacterized membrane protein